MIMKSYISFLKKNEIIENILTILEPRITELIHKIEESEFSQTGRMFTNFQKESTYLHLVYDLIRSVEKYTKSTDKLISIRSHYSRKGNLEINAEIKREDKLYDLLTEVIIAGGYNIQVAHYRYLTKTDLPKTNNSILTNDFSEKIKKLNKTEKLQKDILYYQKLISNCKNRIDDSSKLTDQDIYDLLIKGELSYLTKYTWEELDPTCHAKQIYTKDTWEKHNYDYIMSRVESWKKSNIINQKNDIVIYEKNIKKLQEKINNLN